MMQCFKDFKFWYIIWIHYSNIFQLNFLIQKSVKVQTFKIQKEKKLSLVFLLNNFLYFLALKTSRKKKKKKNCTAQFSK